MPNGSAPSTLAPARPPATVGRAVVLLGPLAVSLVVGMFGPILHYGVAAIAGGFAVAWLSGRPGLALRLLAVLLPLHLLGLSALYQLGLPREIVRPLGFWKEMAVAALVVAAVRSVRAAPRALDALDTVALAYLALAALFLVAPALFVDGPGATLPFGTRLNGVRTDAMYVLLFLAARHARVPAAEVVRAARALVAVAVFAGAVAVAEFTADGWWNTFVTETLGLTRYKLEVLDVLPASDPYLFDVRVTSEVGGRDLLRIGGIVVDYLHFGFWMILAAGVLLERQVRQLGRPAQSAAFGLLVVAVLFTQTRSAVVGLAIVVVLALRRQRGRATAARVRLTLAVGAVLALAVPIALAIGLADRLGGEGDERSDALHADASSSGVELLVEEPLGRGLATAAGAGQRSSGFVVTENQLLQIGTQLGVVGLALWVAVFVLAARRTHAVATSPPPRSASGREVRSVAAATATVLVGLAPSMMFLQIHIYFAFAWTLWSLAGAAVGAVEAASPGDAQQPEPGVVVPSVA